MVATALIFAYWPVLLLVPCLAVGACLLWPYVRRKTAQRISQFVSVGTSREVIAALDTWPRRMRFFLPVAILVLLAVVMARPLVGPQGSSAERKGTDFVLVLDVSKSMWAEDVKPNRLNAVKEALQTWMQSQSGNRMGLVAFAGDAIIQAPITTDFQALERVLRGAGPQTLSKGGTNIPEAISMAKTLLDKSEVDARNVIIISDGENLDGDATTAAREAHVRDGMTIYTIGVGTETGAKVPTLSLEEFAKNPNQRRGYMRNEYGTEVNSQLDTIALERIATAGGGSYQAFSPDTEFFPRYFETTLRPLAGNREVTNPRDYQEWYQAPLLLAIVLLLLEPLLTRKRAAHALKPGVATSTPDQAAAQAGAPVKFVRKTGKVIAPLLALWVGLMPSTSFAEVRDLQKTVENLLEEKKPDEALALVHAAVQANPSDPLTRYNYGLVLAQAGKYEAAIAAFQEARLTATDESFRERVLFQLGNAQVHLAAQLKDESSTILSLERALAFYDELLQSHPGGDGKRNRQVAESTLETFLRKIVEKRLKAAEEHAQKNQNPEASRRLREALDALERLEAIKPEDKELSAQAEQTRKKLAESIMKEAAAHVAETDRIDALDKKEQDQHVLRRREQGLALQERALSLTPEDQQIQQAIQAEKTKMANKLIKRTEETLLPALADEKPDGRVLGVLYDSRKSLNQALALDPEHARAKELRGQTEEKLERELLQVAEKSLNHAQDAKNVVVKNRLRSALAASDAFQRVREFDPDNERAAKGLETLQEILPQLHADVAAQDLAEAAKLLQKDGESAENLKKAVGTLETSTQNFNRALALSPDNEKAQSGLQEAQKMLTESRDKLDEARQSAQSAPQEQAPTSEPTQPAEQAKPTNIQVYSQMPQKSPTAPASSEGFWNRAKQDW